MYNMGEDKITGNADNGMKVSMTMQVADVQKVLAPTAKVCDAGNIQVFTKDGGWIISKNECPSALVAISKVARKIDMKRTGGTCVYDMYAPDAQEVNAPCVNMYQALATVELNDETTQSFTRLGDELI